MDVLFVASEIYPLVKTGGLADVAGALPLALKSQGVRVRTLIPGYPGVIRRIKGSKPLAKIDDLFGGPARLLGVRVAGLDLIVIEAPHLYGREGGPYGEKNGKDWPDNWKRFGALGLAGAMLATGLVKNYRPAIVHAHDWQSGLSAAYLKFAKGHKVKSVFTVHNLAFQGKFGAEIFKELGLPRRAFSVQGIEYYGGVGFLKAGLQYADMLTTVSPTYAREIRTPEFGMGLDGLLNQRTGRLHGILNGIDLEAWNPETDKALVRTYKSTTIKRRLENKAALASKFGLDASEGPLFGVVSRLTWQKGIDILAQNIDQLVGMGGRLCILGSGESELETLLEAACARHRGKVSLLKGYDEDLSHLIQGGADAVLVPSRFEPCGLTQLIGLRYGAVPIVARTGGLADTVIDANAAAIEAGVATGIQFLPDNQRAFSEALARAMELYENPKVWAHMQHRGMKANVSWDNSAKAYAGLYSQLLNE